MSRIGNRKIVVPAGVSVTNENNQVTVKGPKGELSLELVKGIEVAINENTIVVTRPDDEKATKAMHGTTNANIHNMIEGVTQGFTKGLEIIGVGYRFNVRGNTLVINAGKDFLINLENHKKNESTKIEENLKALEAMLDILIQ